MLQATIENLALGDYLDFIGTLFNISDSYTQWNQLKSKMRSCKIEGENFVPLNKRCFDIITNNYRVDDWLGLCVRWIFHDLIHLLKHFPTRVHGWWRFFPLLILNHNDFEQPIERDICLNLYRTYYNVNSEIFQNSNLSEIQKYLIKQLDCQTKEEKIFVRDHCVDWYFKVNLKQWSHMQSHLRPIHLIECGTILLFEHLAKLLGESGTRIEDSENVLQAFVVRLQKHQNSKMA